MQINVCIHSIGVGAISALKLVPGTKGQTDGMLPADRNALFLLLLVLINEENHLHFHKILSIFLEY